MITNTLTFALFLIAFVLAVLGGLGLFGLGADSRGLEARSHLDERPGRSLMS